MPVVLKWFWIFCLHVLHLGPVKKLVRPSSAPLSGTRTPSNPDVWDDVSLLLLIVF